MTDVIISGWSHTVYDYHTLRRHAIFFLDRQQSVIFDITVYDEVTLYSMRFIWAKKFLVDHFKCKTQVIKEFNHSPVCFLNWKIVHTSYTF